MSTMLNGKSRQEEVIKRLKLKNKDQSDTIKDQSNTIKDQSDIILVHRSLLHAGNVYATEPHENHFDFRQLMAMSIKKYLINAKIFKKEDIGGIKNYISDFLNFGNTILGNGDEIVELSKKCKKGHYHSLTSTFSKKYRNDNKICAPRYKGAITTEEIIDGRSGHKNQYPYEYIKIIDAYIENIPIEKWGDLPDNIIQLEHTLLCQKCNSKFVYKSLNGHLKSQKHLK